DLSGNFSGNGTDPAPNDWRELVTGVDPAAQHTLEMRLAYVDGQNNDRIDVYLAGQYIGQTTTFENYHDSLGGSHNANAAANFTDRVFFRGGANGSPQDGPGGLLDAGFYFDNLTTSVDNNTSGTGNGLANVITGNSGDNLLGTYNHNQHAINAGGAGETVRLAAGTYDEFVNTTKNIAIDGANAGTAGTGVRGAESVIRGQLTVSAAHSATDRVTINGVE